MINDTDAKQISEAFPLQVTIQYSNLRLQKMEADVDTDGSSPPAKNSLLMLMTQLTQRMVGSMRRKFTKELYWKLILLPCDWILKCYIDWVKLSIVLYCLTIQHSMYSWKKETSSWFHAAHFGLLGTNPRDSGLNYDTFRLWTKLWSIYDYFVVYKL